MRRGRSFFRLLKQYSQVPFFLPCCLFITNYVDKRGRYCFRMDEILDPETVSSVSAFGETFSVE